MAYATEHIAGRLRAAREAMGLSQRDLSARSGVPQSHISKIENGTVDLRLSSLVELARILDLEFALVPRKLLPAIDAILQGAGDEIIEGASHRRADRELANLRSIISTLPEQLFNHIEIGNYNRVLRELAHLRLTKTDLDTLRRIAETIRKAGAEPGAKQVIHQSLLEMQKLRNQIAHGKVDRETETVRPAYSLDEDDDA